MKKKTAKGYSLFWRKDRGRWCLTFASKAGWSEPVTRFAPENMPRPKRAGQKPPRRVEEWAAQVLENAEQLELFPRARAVGIPLRVRVESWMRIVRANDPKTSPATLKSYGDLFRNVVMRPFKDGGGGSSLGDEDVVALGTDFSLLRRWIRSASKQHSPSRVRGAFFALRVFYDDAIVEKWFRGSNPLRNSALERELPSLPTARERGGVIYVELAIAQQLIASPRVPLRRRARYALVSTTGGFRDGEISGLTWGRLEGLDDESVPARIEVAEARRLIRAKHEVLGATKTKTTKRVIPLHPAARDALRDWRDSETEGVTMYLGRAPLPSDPVFPSARARDRGAFARPNSPELLRTDLAAAGLPTAVKGRDITFHTLRKSFGTWLYELDADEITRKRLMGHGTHDVTAEFYTGEAFQKMIAALASLPLRWTTGIRYEPVLPAFAPNVEAKLPPAGTLASRVLELARANPRATSTGIAHALGSKPGTTATLMSDLRAAGLLPRPLPGVVSIGRGAAPNAIIQLEPPSRLELETYGLRIHHAEEATRAGLALDVVKEVPATLQVGDLPQGNGAAEELTLPPGRATPRAPGKNRGARPRVASGAGEVRIENANGVVLAAARASAGELVADLEERLRLDVRQRTEGAHQGIDEIVNLPIRGPAKARADRDRKPGTRRRSSGAGGGRRG